jgi:1,6-anhydro-N-acetylmuramate kinase
VEDTYALYRYAARCVLPSVLAAAAKRAKAAAPAADAPPAPPFRAGDWVVGGDGAPCAAAHAPPRFGAARLRLHAALSAPCSASRRR